MKKCNSCKKTKESKDFYRSNQYKDGYIKQCRDCKSEYSRQYRKINRDLLLKKLRKRHRKNRIDALIYYGGNPPKCACCGENKIEFLSIDHINNDGAKHRKEIGGSSMQNYWLKLNSYPSGFQVLCYNCNCAKGYCGYCPHNKKFNYLKSSKKLRIEVFKQ